MTPDELINPNHFDHGPKHNQVITMHPDNDPDDPYICYNCMSTDLKFKHLGLNDFKHKDCVCNTCNSPLSNGKLSEGYVTTSNRSYTTRKLFELQDTFGLEHKYRNISHRV